MSREVFNFHEKSVICAIWSPSFHFPLLFEEYRSKYRISLIRSIGSLFDINFPEYKNPVLVLKTEETGSKQLLAFQNNRYESIGIDMINHLINGCIVMVAIPLAVQDAIICGKLEKDKVIRIISGINQACLTQGCTLIGGEISEQPAGIPAGTYILTSSIVGIVDKPDIIDGSSIEIGDIVMCLESCGLHTNGYSLLRKLLEIKPINRNTRFFTIHGD